MANLQFYYINKIDVNSTFSFTSASTALAGYLYDNMINPQLFSVGSSDIIPESYEITFNGTVAIDTIILQNHNFKAYTMQYWNGASYVDFSTPISVTNNAVANNDHSFNSVSTTKVKLIATTAQVVNAQKKIGDLKVLQTIGTLSLNPYKCEIEYQENSKSYYTSGKENLFVLFGAGIKIKAKFEGLTASDMNIIYNLKFLGSPFLLYLNGESDTAKIEYGWRVGDIFCVNLTDDYKPKLRSDILGIGQDIDLVFEATHQTL